MKVVNIHHPYDETQIPHEEVVLVLGFFDGLHKGHQKVIETGRQIAAEKNLKLAVMTFNQHPSIVFQKQQLETMKYLTSLTQKERLMAELNVDILYIIEFTSDFAKLPPQTFVDQYMVNLHAKYVVTGFDYSYGPKDIASVMQLPAYSKGRFTTVTVPKEANSGVKISSTRIRKCLDKGQIKEVNDLLGYLYEIEGTVVHGDARGRALGYPTANVRVASSVRLPQEGVYACEIYVGGTWHQAMGSIGRNETFERNRPVTVEVNIFDFAKDIYGEKVLVRWHDFIRGQVKFAGIDGLIAQLKQDEVDTRNYFNGK